MVGKVGKEKTIFNKKNGCFPLTSLQLFMISSPLGQQPGEGSPGWLAHMADWRDAWRDVWPSSFIPWWILWLLLIHEDLGCLFWQCCSPSEGLASPVMWSLRFPSCWKFSHHQEGFSLAETSSWLAPWSFLWCVLSLPSSSTTTLLSFDPLDSCPTFH